MCGETLVTPVVVDRKGQPVVIAPSRRTVSPATRRALESTYKTCPIDGCDRPAWQGEPHHIIPFSEGGLSDFANSGGSPCRPHHRLIHEGRWRIRKLPDGTLVVEPPKEAREAKARAPGENAA